MQLRPEHDEAVEYFWTYINQVEGSDVLATLRDQKEQLLTLLKGISEEKSLHRYGPDKWSIREVLSHINDTERAFVFRAFSFARGLSDPLPSFDQDLAIAGSGAHQRSWASHLEDWLAVREATMTLFETLPAEAWLRRGIANGNPFTVRALAFITAGHATHHVRLLKERYGIT